MRLSFDSNLLIIAGCEDKIASTFGFLASKISSTLGKP